MLHGHVVSDLYIKKKRYTWISFIDLFMNVDMAQSV